MKLQYYKDVDILYITFSDKKILETRELTPLIVGDFDTEENVVGLEISRASHFIDLAQVQVLDLPTD